MGAVLSLLGKKVTLTGCNLATRHWLVSQAARLVRARKILERELEKFIHIQPVYERYVRHYQGPGDRTNSPLNPIDPKFSSRGEVNLRRLIEEVGSTPISRNSALLVRDVRVGPNFLVLCIEQYDHHPTGDEMEVPNSADLQNT